MALFRKFFYKKPPDRLLEISERVYVFDCCFSADVMEESEFEGYIKGIMMQTRDHFPDASFMVFNFHEGEKESQMASLLSQYDLIVMDYPFHYEGCPLLKMEMIHHFLRSCESWLSLGQQNFLLMHCEQGGWPTLAFMLAALMIYLKQYTGEKRTLEMVYKQAPHDFIELLSPLNPMPSQLRYLQYVSKSVASEWPLFDRALTLDCVILRMIPQFDMEGGCRPIFRIYGQDPLFLSDQTTKLLYSTPKSSNTVRHYRQADCEVVKIDIHCHIQGDVLLECIHLYEDLEQEQIIFRIMFNTDFIKSNILMLNHDQIDILWDKKSLFPKDFRAEVLLSEIESMTAINTADLVNVEEKEGLPMEAFDMVQEIFSHLEWLDAKDDTTIYKHQQIIPSHNFQEKLENLQNDNKPQLSIFDKHAEMPRYSEVSILSESERSEVKTISSSLLPDTQFPEPTELALSKTHSQTPEPLFSDRSGLSEPLNSSSHTPASPPLSSTTNTHIASFTKLTCTSSQHPPVSQLLLPTSSAQGSVAKPPPLVTVFPPKPVVLSHPSPASMPTLHPENSILQSPRLIPASTMSTFPPHESLVTSSPSPSLVPPKSTFQSPPPLSLPSPPRSTSNSSLAPQSPYPPPPPPLPPALEKSTPQQSFSKLPPIPPPPPPPPPSPLPPALEKSTPQHSFSKLPPIPLPPPPASKTLTSPNELSKTSLQPLLELHRVPSQGSTSSAPLPPLPSFSEASLSHVSPESSQSTSESTSLKPIPSPPSPPQSPALTDAKVTLPPPTKPLNFEPLKVSKSASAAPPLPPPPPPTLPSNQSSSPPVVPPPPPPLVSLGSIESRKQGVPPPPLPDAASIKRSNASSIRGNSLRPAKGPGNSHSTQSRRNLKPLHWVKVTRALQGSLWAEAQKSKESSEVPEIDICELESLFPAVVPNSDAPTGGEKAKRRSSLGGKPDKVHLIDLRRANNCEIMLTKIKMPLPDLMNSLIALDDSVLDVDQLDNLIKFCPTKEEIELLQGYIGDKERLGKCEQFFLELMKVPRVGNKLRVFSYKIQFHTQVADLSNSLNVVNTAANEIRGSVKLKKILQTILSLGNALNQGTARGSAVGFRLDSLLKLTDIRARNNKMTLMHYLCKVLADKLPEVLDFEKDLLNLEVASKIQLKILAEEMQAINEGLEKVEQELTASENDGPVSEIFHKTLKEFLGIAESKIRSLTSLYSAVGRNADALALYFGEDPARCPFEQVISTLFTFTKMFGRAHEENCRQLELDRKKAQRESDKAKIKITVLKNELGNPPSPT